MLVPLFFFLFGTWAWIKRVLKKSGKEYPREYYRQAFFTGVGLAIAIFIDKNFLEDLLATLTFGMVDVMIARWLLYPAILVGLAYLSGMMKAKVPEAPKQIVR